MSECLAVIGAVSIQDYIFRSNRLREQVAASRKITEALALDQWGGRALFVGGGNAVVRFPSLEYAKRHVHEWSRGQLADSPGLRFSVGYSEIASEDNGYYEALRERQACEEFPPGGGEPGAFPICVTCPSTGLAATTTARDDQKRPLSAEAASKRMMGMRPELDRYRDRLSGWEFPLDLDQLGATEGASQVAIVHADGNNFGDLVREALEQEGLVALRQLSEELTRIGRQTWNELIGGLRIQAERWDSEKRLALKQSGNAGFFMPIRPIVDGGDDATWVCAGKIGVATAAKYLQIFEQQARNAGKGNLTACAGVAIVPKGYPFSRAYALAAELCKSAKRRSREESGLDFHIVLGGSTQALEDLRPSTSVYGRYSARPHRLHGEWDAVEAAINHFQQEWPRSRAKSLLQGFGRNSPGDEIALHQHRGYAQPQGTTEKQVFDALELLDFHLPWNQEGRDATTATN